MSQAELAKLAKVGVTTISRFEKGEIVPYDRTLRDLQAALEKQGIEFLFDGAVGIGIRAKRGATSSG